MSHSGHYHHISIHIYSNVPGVLVTDDRQAAAKQFAEGKITAEEYKNLAADRGQADSTSTTEAWKNDFFSIFVVGGVGAFFLIVGYHFIQSKEELASQGMRFNSLPDLLIFGCLGLGGYLAFIAGSAYDKKVKADKKIKAG